MHLGEVTLSLSWSGVFESLESLVSYLDGFLGVFESHFGAFTDNLSCCWVFMSALIFRRVKGKESD